MDSTVKPQDTNGSVTASPSATGGLQPFLHDAVVTLHAPSLVISGEDGQLSGGADGFYHGDRRALSRLTVTADDIALAPVQGGLRGADRAGFRAILRGLGEVTPDPVVALHRRRSTANGRLEEVFEVTNAGGEHVRFRLTVSAGSDLATMEQVKSGHVIEEVSPQVADCDAIGLAWSADDFAVRLAAEPVPDALQVPTGELSYDIDLKPGTSRSLTLTCTAAYMDGDQFPAPPADQLPWSVPTLRSADRRLDQWLQQSLADLDRLRLTDRQSPDPDRPDQFLAAGAPWYLTLFGRDALWAARMLLPLGADLAAGTLRTLARRQGAVTDPATEEQPGKILHEVRRATLQIADRLSLPPVYYGTVDATPLWITLLHDAWRWGMSPAAVEELLPHAEAALAWMRDAASADGFLTYVDQTGHGLSNQGWKDSDDSIRYSDGRRAHAPIALCEVQAYAYEAARAGAALLRAFGRPGADAWEDWADQLATRFRERFWVRDEKGAFPAVALDGDGKPVDSVTSGFGHLLGTGLLNAQESALLAARLTSPDLDAGHGLRTLSSDAVGYNPYGYHVGSIWPHDTAIAVHGLVKAGFPDAAASLADGLLGASAAFDARLPELFAGHGSEAGTGPAPYPASCRPQAWAAASSVLILQAALGLDADAPAGTVTVTPTFAHNYGPLTVTGLQVNGERLDVVVTADGSVQVTAPEALAVTAA
ncbi:amylo-alpha-1,6-glucosidase [Streptomyces sp. SLBN-118]|uniref:amylo-alpha-1,6-glucosidase n=1 Tax=Streptomyces sp. SLBN-118 TaxID=2768454 RepID=UPI00115106C5|nr:glycogen debranching N-terminal domain-containing protein [Streptomyces sp. SLBN-118]TQK45187.1 amylo-alpha-1,6-glucosidase [Streptomyces sp. SLBN-118]